MRIGAIALMSPRAIPAAATPKQSAEDTRGSSVAPNPRPRKPGRMRSLARAWSTLGAQRKLPTALDSVAAQTPTSTSSGQREHFSMIIVSVLSQAESVTNVFMTIGTAV